MAYKLSGKEALCFDDVLILPGFSDVEHRGDVDLSVYFAGTELRTPIISANMDTITDHKMWMAMRKAGGFAYIHRFMLSADRLKLAETHLHESNEHPAMSIGIGPEEFEIALMMIERGVNHICIDIAHGDHVNMYNMISSLRNKHDRDKLTICAGNVCMPKAVEALRDAGADIVKIGIGPGAVCSTRIVTGVGYPQLAAIDQCSVVDNVLIIADGGIRGSGDISKAIAAGADVVMIGSLISGTNETPGEMKHNTTTGAHWKTYRGMASTEAMRDRRKEPFQLDRVAEGVSIKVKSKGPVANIIRELNEGVQSTCSYVGAHNLKQLQQKAIFSRVSVNSVAESKPRV